MSFKGCHFLMAVFVAAEVMVVKVSMSQVAREKRTDDISPLEAVVEQLSQQITSLNAQLTPLINEVALLRTKTNKTVAFYAWNSNNPVQALAHGTLILNHAGTNIGNAYNTRTGIFTAPVSGLYYFQTTFVSYRLGAGQYAHGSIYVGDKIMAVGISDSQHGHYDQTTINTVVHVTAGEEVYVVNIDNESKEYYDALGSPHTTFSGFLICAD